MTTIKDIAHKSGVSVATVSYVLNNTRWVHEEKRKRVLEAISELNYVPNAVARGLRVQKSKAISFVVSDITNPFYPDLAKACEDLAQTKGFTINILNTDDKPDRTQLALNQVREGKVDGIIVTSALEQDREHFQKFMEQGYVLVLANRFIKGLQVDSVVADNFNGAVMATNHLNRLGHQKIAFMPGITGSSITESRMNGYVKAMTDAGLTIYPEWKTSGGARYSGSYDTTKFLLGLPEEKRPTAILSLTDIGALGVLDAATDLGVSVPDDLAVIGFDDLFISGTRSIQLTTVSIPRYEMGNLATTLLLDRLEKTAKPEFQEIVLPVQLIVRKTCGKQK
ncbi:LacI family DNA-binding transcriptional regulator [Paenibacillus sp. Soil750]|uniref:LacI family DNA-binding transcriptional regulator n=1 Tax=Paenibacillus sp. Soil750 TaxID=1736398 RepID=UPI0006FF6B28|nr:LacI family DNA-binding transcriptional regulator [Paenibacillus sp. Soil750]KRE69656.1 hypothetical protein ASL11_14895 [Paenibacillus sp. Soil750]